MPGLSVEELSIREAQVTLAAQSERFRGSMGGWTPLHEPSYLRLWEQTLGTRSDCRIVVAWDNTGDLAGYAPLMRVRGRVGPMPVPTLRFIGNNLGYPGDILYAEVFAATHEQAAVSAILSHVASNWSIRKWELGYLPPASPTWRAASEVLGPGFVAAGTLPSVPFVSMHVPAEWDAYFASLTSNTRSSYRRGLRHLDSQGRLTVVIDTTPEGARRRVEELVRNHMRWLAGTEKEHWFGDRAVRRFLLSSSELLAREGQFLSTTLELDGEPIAWVAGPAYGRTHFAQISSYDRTHSEDSPGLVLGIELVRELIRRGFQRFDLGPGSSLYKQRLGGVESRYLRVLGYQGWVRRAAWAQGLIRRAHVA